MSTEEQIQDEARSASTDTFVAALILHAAIFGAEILIFTLVRKRFRVIYEPRTYLTAENKRQQSLSSNILGWPISIWKADFNDIKHHNGMDAYFFVRFLRMLTKIFIPIWIISWLVLLPVNGAGNTRGYGGLDQFTFGNVAQSTRYSAHLILAWFFTAWILFNLKKEMRNFVIQRQRHLVDPVHSASAQANTILVTGVPRKFLDERSIARLFSHLPGGVKKVWLNRDLKDLPELYERRVKASEKLEKAETDLLNKALKLNKKANNGKVNIDLKGDLDAEGGTRASDRYVPANERPTHRLPVLGFLPFGKKVDSIEWASQEIMETTEELEKERDLLASETGTKGQKYPPLNSVFVLFNQQIGAHLAAQALTHNEPYRMAEKFSEVAPADVIFDNLGLNPYEKRVRQAISYAATAGLIILWSIPVSFVGIVANVSGLCQYSWLAWLCEIPQSVLGIIQGILPPALLAVLMMLLPIVLRLLGRFEGIPTKTGIELSLMTRYFIFLVVHGFLVTTISGGIVKAIPELTSDPTSIPNLLAANLPTASTFFLTYAILQALSGTAGGLLQAVPLIVYYIKLFVLGSTPRSVYKIKYDLRDVFFGTLWPSISLLMVISTGYMIITPVINGIAALAFFLFFFVWKYLFLWQLDQPASGDTGGLFFPKAVQHVFVGLYVQQVCLAALFFLAPSAKVMGGLMIALIILTAFFHIILNSSYSPLVHSLPLSLAHKSYGMENNNGRASPESSSDGGDFGGDGVTPDRVESKKTYSNVPIVKNAAPTGTVQANSGPGPSQEYGDSVPVDGKRNDGPTDFNHPASVEPQRIVWIPDDPLGLGQMEANSLNMKGVQASTEHARMDEKGHVDIDSHPPGSDPTTMFA